MNKAVLLAIALAAAGVLFWLAGRPGHKSSLSEPLTPLLPLPVRRSARRTALPNIAPSAYPAVSNSGKAGPGPGVGGRAPQQAALSAVPAADAPAQKLVILEDILRSRNDNDPRLDTAFNDLSPQAKRLFRQKYRQLPAESRNELGTVVYLLGRNLKTDEDWAFLREVVAEPPCLSLADCSRGTKAEPDSDLTIGAGVTLSYPAIMALKGAERILQTGRGDAAQALQLIAAAKSSRAKTVLDLAARLEQRYSRP